MPNFFGECEIKDIRTKIADKNSLNANEKFTEIKLDCNGESVTIAIGKKEGDVFIDVKKGGSIISKRGENAVRFLLGK